MRWADWILYLFTQSPPRFVRKRTRLNIVPLEGRDVPHATGGEMIEHDHEPVDEEIIKEETPPIEGEVVESEDGSIEVEIVPDETILPEEGELDPEIYHTMAGEVQEAEALNPNPNAPLRQVGDRVWKDLNGDGFQDPGEPGVGFLNLELYLGGTLVGSTITDALGNYAFNKLNVHNGTINTADDGILPNTDYQIRVSNSQTAMIGLRPTLANQGQGIVDDNRDSDGVAVEGGVVLAFNTDIHELTTNLDIGFAPAATIGDSVWRDANSNGKKDANEVGIGGVTVRLLDVAGGTALKATTTDANGNYLFTGLMPATYFVEIAATNFATGGVLAGHVRSAALNQTEPVENGVAFGKSVTVGPNSMDNRTIDFGFFEPATLKGRVFVDRDGNGTRDTDDVFGLAGVKIRAAGAAGIFTTTTGANGDYSFAALPAGAYTITEVPQPAGYRSSTPNLVTTTISVNSTTTVNFGEVAAVDLKVTQTASRRTVGVGGFVTLTYKIQNLGALTASGVLLTAPFGKGFKYIATESAAGSYDPMMQRSSIGTLAPGAEVIIKIRVQAMRAGTVTLRATALAAQPEENVGNNSSTVNMQAKSIAKAAPVKKLTGNWMLGKSHL
jgi:hypothetical protein